MINLLSPLAYRIIPWKNGGGSTTEIAVDPDGAGWDEFNWRVAIADIRESGPFSSFPGIDRSIALLEAPYGTSMALLIDGKRTPMRPREFIDFAGEATTEGVVDGALRGGVVRDFNVMSRRGAVRHRRGWHPLSPNAVHRMGGIDTRVVYVADGTADLINAVTSRTVVAGESLVATGDDLLQLRGGPDGAQLVWVVFSTVVA